MSCSFQDLSAFGADKKIGIEESTRTPVVNYTTGALALTKMYQTEYALFCNRLTSADDVSIAMASEVTP